MVEGRRRVSQPCSKPIGLTGSSWFEDPAIGRKPVQVSAGVFCVDGQLCPNYVGVDFVALVDQCETSLKVCVQGACAYCLKPRLRFGSQEDMAIQYHHETGDLVFEPGRREACPAEYPGHARNP